MSVTIELRNSGEINGQKATHGDLVVRASFAVDPVDAWLTVSQPTRRVRLTPGEALALADDIREMALDASYEE